MFKCLDIPTGRVYISRDVVFDENIFPFSKLHPNAGARLRSELLLLPSTLLNPVSGDESVVDPVSDNANPVDFGARNNVLQEETENDRLGTGVGADTAAVPY